MLDAHQIERLAAQLLQLYVPGNYTCHRIPDVLHNILIS